MSARRLRLTDKQKAWLDSIRVRGIGAFAEVPTSETVAVETAGWLNYPPLVREPAGGEG